MGIPKEYKLSDNLANYEFNLKEKLIKNYGIDLENKFDSTDNYFYNERIFCRDCLHFRKCKGRFWKSCPIRAEMIKIIRR
jgi:hypothetical protein